MHQDKIKYYIMFNPTKNWVAVGPPVDWEENKKPYESIGADNDFRVLVENGTINVWINDELLIEDHYDRYLASLDDYQITIGAKYSWYGSELTYKNLKIEPLEPEE